MSLQLYLRLRKAAEGVAAAVDEGLAADEVDMRCAVAIYDSRQ